MKQTKKVIRKQVRVNKSELTQKRVIEKKHGWFKSWVAKKLKLELVENYQYLFRISYTGRTKLQLNDIVFNSDGIIFVVVRDSNRIAMLVTKDSFADKPKMHGTLTILDEARKDKPKMKKV